MAAQVHDDGIFIIDADGRILTWSTTAASITGLSSQEALGSPFSALYVPEDADAGKPARDLAAVLTTGHHRTEGWRARRPDSRFWADVSLCRLSDDGEHAPRFAVILRDRVERQPTPQAAQSVVDQTPDAVLTFDAIGVIRSCNRNASAMFGLPRAEMPGSNVQALIPSAKSDARDQSGMADTPAQTTAQWAERGRETSGCRHDGTTFPIHLSISRCDDDGESLFTAVVRDLTEQKMLESRLHALEKMQALGQLTGGVAHNFNNLLMIVGGYCETLRNQTGWTDPHRAALEQIAVAAEQATLLTSQLLAFSSRSSIEPAVFDLHAALVQTGQLLQPTIGENITVGMHLAPHALRVRMNQGDIGQILINLAINARDAMPRGGTFSVRTRLVTLDSPTAVRRGLFAGDYVQLEVRDTGTGMTPETKARAFEPYFTTKPSGRGTGLGLATVRGIVTQCGGDIELETAPGEGTVFTMLLPAIQEDVPATLSAAEPNGMPVGTETVLVVEDEAVVREIVASMLRDLGYRTLEASSVLEALSAIQAEGAKVDLLVSDVVMPLVGGPELAERLRQDAPAMKVLFMSGYTDDRALSERLERSEVVFLQKPFNRLTLARKVRAALEGQGPGTYPPA